MTHKDGIYFDNGLVQVSRDLVSTQRRYYPLRNTTARIRRDPLWLGFGITVFVALTTTIYSDLLYIHELTMLWVIACSALIVGANISILHIDSIGHPHALVFGKTGTIRQIYKAMREAHLGAVGHGNIHDITEPSDQSFMKESN